MTTKGGTVFMAWALLYQLAKIYSINYNWATFRSKISK